MNAFILLIVECRRLLHSLAGAPWFLALLGLIVLLDFFSSLLSFVDPFKKNLQLLKNHFPLLIRYTLINEHENTLHYPTFHLSV